MFSCASSQLLHTESWGHRCTRYTETPLLHTREQDGAGLAARQQFWKGSSRIRVGLVVNDVADVNIDADLIRRTSGARITPYTTVELQNGCACCTRSDELFDSIRQLLDLGISIGSVCLDLELVDCLQQLCLFLQELTKAVK